MASTADQKAKAKILHGKGYSERAIAGELEVSRATAKGWIDEWEKAGLKKGHLQPELDQKEREAAITAAERAGLTRAKVAKKVVSLMEAKKTVFHQGKVAKVVHDNSTQLGATSLGADILGMKKADEEAAKTNDTLLHLIRSFRPK